MKYLKKILSILGIIITFFIIYFLQINFFSWFNIAGIKPNLFILLILCIGLFIGKNFAIPLGIILGLYLDLLTNNQIGITAIMFLLIAVAANYLDKNFSKESKITILIMVAGTTFAYEVLYYIYILIKNSLQIEFLAFLKIVFIEIIFNTLLTIILYPVIRKVGYILENIFKKTNNLTRYF